MACMTHTCTRAICGHMWSDNTPNGHCPLCGAHAMHDFDEEPEPPDAQEQLRNTPTNPEWLGDPDKAPF